MMHIQDDFENTRASLFHRSPIPTLNVVLHELISEETCQKTRRVYSTDLVMVATPSTTSTIVATASSKPRRFNGQCHYCKEEGHQISDCTKKKAKDARDAEKAKAHTSTPRFAIMSHHQKTRQQRHKIILLFVTNLFAQSLQKFKSVWSRFGEADVVVLWIGSDLEKEINDFNRHSVRALQINPISRTLSIQLVASYQKSLQEDVTLLVRDSTPDPDPATAAGTATGGALNSKTDPPPQPHDPPATSSNTTDSIRYKECLKNHAASVGGHVLDGCGEFMPSGEEGTPEALRCAACDCHRSFHRREADGEPQIGTSHYYTYNPNSSNNNSHRNPVIHSQTPPTLLPQQHQHFTATPSSGPTRPMVVAFGGNSGGAGAESSSEDLNMFQSNARGHAVVQPTFSGSKKRFRTKFSQEQKDRMHEFATRLGWKIQKQDEQELQQFCNEMGVKRQVFKVWMHNNKQAMKKREI
ncbi:zinc-finger homeodomain protein 6 [Forsythia ovata]|uniref:Zinc-finger homeodomain protein 6 n=1 Tax=Forsythia ovata TaxID=205694 RepID=A0ABD1WTL8_9LAMI